MRFEAGAAGYFFSAGSGAGCAVSFVGIAGVLWLGEMVSGMGGGGGGLGLP